MFHPNSYILLQTVGPFWFQVKCFILWFTHYILLWTIGPSLVQMKCLIDTSYIFCAIVFIVFPFQCLSICSHSSVFLFQYISLPHKLPTPITFLHSTFPHCPPVTIDNFYHVNRYVYI